MFTAVAEAARTISPLSNAISFVLTKIYIGTYEFFEILSYRRRMAQREKDIKALVYSLRMEYPFEADEYLEYMARNQFKDII